MPCASIAAMRVLVSVISNPGDFERMVDQRRGGRDDAVGVDVDGLDAFAVDRDLAAPRLFGWRWRRAGHCAADESDAGQSAADYGHVGFSPHWFLGLFASLSGIDTGNAIFSASMLRLSS